MRKMKLDDVQKYLFTLYTFSIHTKVNKTNYILKLSVEMMGLNIRQ